MTTSGFTSSSAATKASGDAAGKLVTFIPDAFSSRITVSSAAPFCWISRTLVGFVIFFRIECASPCLKARLPDGGQVRVDNAVLHLSCARLQTMSRNCVEQSDVWFAWYITECDPDLSVPELPEVERAARALSRAALGKTIAAVRAIHPALKRKLPPGRARAVRGKSIQTIERRGKHQLLGLDNGDTLVVHFRMNGDWLIGRTSDELDRFARAVIELQDGTRISLVDRRALSSITLDKEGSSSLPKLGKEASDRTL